MMILHCKCVSAHLHSASSRKFLECAQDLTIQENNDIEWSSTVSEIDVEKEQESLVLGCMVTCSQMRDPYSVACGCFLTLMMSITLYLMQAFEQELGLLNFCRKSVHTEQPFKSRWHFSE